MTDFMTNPTGSSRMIGLAFTPEQFKTLLQMIYVANTVVNGHREKEFLKKYDDLEQYIFSRAGAAGFPAATLSHKAPGEEHHHPSRIFENDPELARLLDEYDHAMMTELLVEELSVRDIEAKHGPAAKERVSAKDYEELFDLYAEAYEDEFRQFAFTRLIIAKEALTQNTADAEKKHAA